MGAKHMLFKYYGAGGANTCLEPLVSAGDTTPVFSISSIIRAALL
jgi:hypothetical protein